MVKPKAILYMVLSALAFTIMNSLIKSIENLSAMQVVFFRSVGSAGIGLAYLRRNKIPIIGKHQGLLIARSVVGLIAMTLFFMSLKVMPIASAISLRYTSPIFAAFMAIYIFKERMRWVQWLLFAIAFSGVVLIKGFDNRISFQAFVVIMTSAVFSGLVYILIRKLTDKEHPVRIVTYFMCISTIAGGISCLFSWTSPLPSQWWILMSLGIFGYFGQYYMTLGLQSDETSKIVPFKYSEAIITIIAGWLFFSESQSSIAILGILIIIGSLSAYAMIGKK
jgi:drug/metabolite transporter (DMT)-like permease